jgi:type IV pilus assembly protein PilE
MKVTVMPAPLLRREGFTLIEILIVVAILGIIMAIATPVYTSYRLRSNRSDAKVKLLEGAQQLERYYTRNAVGGYVGYVIPANLSGTLYTVTFAAGEPTANTFELQAVAQGSQAADTGCTTLTINHLQQRLPAACW